MNLLFVFKPDDDSGALELGGLVRIIAADDSVHDDKYFHVKEVRDTGKTAMAYPHELIPVVASYHA